MSARVAALYDVHGNLPALEAVLRDVERAGVDAIVVGGDVAAGPMPGETLDRLGALPQPVRYVMGNADRELVDAFDGGAEPGDDDDPSRRLTLWAAARLERRHRDALAAFEPRVSLEIAGLGPTLFVHASPRRDTDIVTSLTPEERLRPMLEGVRERTIVHGHTHRQHDRTALGRRLLNAGSVGMPYEGDAAAFWLLLAPEPELRRTPYDVDAAARAMRATGCPDVDEAMLRASLLEPADPAEVERFFEDAAAREGS